MMRVDLVNMLRQVSEALERFSRRDTDDLYVSAYLASLDQLREHIEQVRSGTATLDEFADLYMLRQKG